MPHAVVVSCCYCCRLPSSKVRFSSPPRTRWGSVEGEILRTAVVQFDIHTTLVTLASPPQRLLFNTVAQLLIVAQFKSWAKFHIFSTSLMLLLSCWSPTLTCLTCGWTDGNSRRSLVSFPFFLLKSFHLVFGVRKSFKNIVSSLSGAYPLLIFCSTIFEKVQYLGAEHKITE